MQKTPRCHKAFEFARDVAVQAGRASLSSVDLIYGLTALQTGVAAQLLLKSNVTFSNFKFPQNPFGYIIEEDGFFLDLSALITVRCAEGFAEFMEHTYLGTEHILYGSLCDDFGPASSLYIDYQIDPASLKQTILSELKQT